MVECNETCQSKEICLTNPERKAKCEAIAKEYESFLNMTYDEQRWHMDHLHHELFMFFDEFSLESTYVDEMYQFFMTMLNRYNLEYYRNEALTQEVESLKEKIKEMEKSK